ncbi:MAG: DUF4153 domain-containing protein [Pseudomonadota bacterium]
MSPLPLLTAIVGVLVCVTIERLGTGSVLPQLESHYRIAAAAAIAVAGVSFALCLTAMRAARDLLFSLLCGTVIGALVFGQLEAERMTGYSVAALVIAWTIALPLYQATGPHPRSRYNALHRHAWTNILVTGIATLFAGIAFGCAWLLAHLFNLIHITLLEDLLDNLTFSAALLGASAGAAAGVLRQHTGVVSATKGVMQSVMSLLAVPIGVGLPVFLVTLFATGLAPLWDARLSATVAVLTAAMVAVLLANSVLRSSDDDVTRNPLVRLAARALSLSVLPLTAIALLALALRVNAHGLTPDRIWGSITIAVALLYGIAYLWAAVPGLHWMDRIRQSNVVLATLVCALALILASPVLDFGAVAAKQQLSRVESGEVSIEQFDAAALAHDFGPGGRAVLEAFDAADDDVLAARIDDAMRDEGKTLQARAATRANLQVQPANATPPDDLIAVLTRDGVCQGSYCHVILQENTAVVLHDACYWRELRCPPVTVRYQRNEASWTEHLVAHDHYDSTELADLSAAATGGAVSIRPITRAQVFIGDIPVGDNFDPRPFLAFTD